MFNFDNTAAVERQQPMAIAIRKVGKMYEIRDSITFRPIPIWLVVGCPDGEVFFGPESCYNRDSNGLKALKRKRLGAKHGPRESLGASLIRELDTDIIERIRGVFDDEN